VEVARLVACSFIGSVAMPVGVAVAVGVVLEPGSVGGF